MSNSQVTKDACLVKQAQAGDTDAFGALYERYAQTIFRFLFAQLSNRVDAEDLTSDVFLRAWRSLPRYRERNFPFSAYLFRIARNVLIDHYRLSSREEILSTSDVGDLIDDGASASKIIATKLEHQDLYNNLGKLRENYRTVLVLRFLNELSPQETAQVMKRSEGAVRVLQHRALSALRKIIAKTS